jgi:hypothetical protein
VLRLRGLRALGVDVAEADDLGLVRVLGETDEVLLRADEAQPDDADPMFRH